MWKPAFFSSALIAAVLVAPEAVGGPPAGQGTAAQPGTVELTLASYFQETITHAEAVRRLQGRQLPQAAFHAIEAKIPERTEHFLSLSDGWFREYAQFGTGPLEVVLILPLEKVGDNKWIIPIPASNSLGSKPAGQWRGVPVHEFETRDGKLIVDGVARETFTLHDGPTPVRCDASALGPTSATNASLRSSCCDACHWVHSRLGLHDIDKLCCLGGCK